MEQPWSLRYDYFQSLFVSLRPRRIEDRSFFCLGSCIWVVLGVCKALVMAGHSKTNYFFGQTGSRLSAVPACRSTTLLHHGCCGLVRTPSETIVQVPSLRGVAECIESGVVSVLPDFIQKFVISPLARALSGALAACD